MGSFTMLKQRLVYVVLTIILTLCRLFASFPTMLVIVRTVFCGGLTVNSPPASLALSVFGGIRIEHQAPC